MPQRRAGLGVAALHEPAPPARSSSKAHVARPPSRVARTLLVLHPAALLAALPLSVHVRPVRQPTPPLSQRRLRTLPPAAAASTRSRPESNRTDLRRVAVIESNGIWRVVLREVMVGHMEGCTFKAASDMCSSVCLLRCMYDSVEAASKANRQAEPSGAYLRVQDRSPSKYSPLAALPAPTRLQHRAQPMWREL